MIKRITVVTNVLFNIVLP